MHIKLSRALMCSKSLEATFSVLFSSDDLGGYTGSSIPQSLNSSPYLYWILIARDAIDDLFWSRLCEIHRRGRIVDFPIDGITKNLDHAIGYLGIGAIEQPEAERRLRVFEGEGLVKIVDRIYRLTPQGEQHCQRIPRMEA
jgi:hypothetical protein